MNRALVALVLLTGCASLQPERRIAPADQAYRVHRVLVMPVLLGSSACPEEIDRRARTDAILRAVTRDTLHSLQLRGYDVQPPASEAARTGAYGQELGKLLCAGGSLSTPPAEIIARAASEAERAGASQVLLTSFDRVRWHLQTSLQGNPDDRGELRVDTDEHSPLDAQDTSFESINAFDVRAHAALVDVASRRVVWSEAVETRVLTGSYDDALRRVLLFDAPHGRDPHEKLFYDFPPPAR